MKALIIFVLFLLAGCTGFQKEQRIPVLFDTDANNELDDQHALAYLLFNGNTFQVAGITVNATINGGDATGHYDEAKRVMQLCGEFGKIPLMKGATGSFSEIRSHLNDSVFDGSDAVNFILEQSRKERKEKLVLVPVGKLTNIALALAKDSSIASRVRIVWLGSNYPEKGEYNLENDMDAVNYVLAANVPFEIVTVRYGSPTGSGFVTVTQDEINITMPGKGPVSEPVTGRHGGTFTCFGDYSVSLFSYIDYSSIPHTRSLFDMTAVAVLKNPEYGSSISISAPKLENGEWVEQPGNPRKILIWENFNRDEIIKDFQRTMENYVLAEREK
jgi:purine nucleosidase